MENKESIVNLLKINGAMTSRALAEAIYRDINHVTNINQSLEKLIDSGMVIKEPNKPYYFSLSGSVSSHKNTKRTKKRIRDVSGDVISNETIDEANLHVSKTDNYGAEMQMITRCLRRFPENTDQDVVAMKIGLIDITNSTHLSQYKSKISMFELSKIIASIPDIDNRIKSGDPEVVNLIARSNGKINLFSFATKYCCYHNRNLYEHDDY